MLKRLGVIVLWVLATIGTASLTYAAVTSADRAVGDAPSGPVAGADVAARMATTTTAPAPDTTSSGVAITTTVVVPPATTTTIAATGSTSVTTPTTAPAGSTTTTTAGPATQWKTIPGVGTVGVAVSGSSVTLVSATPVAPYDVDVEDDGPEKIDVEFESETDDYRVRAEVSGGELIWQVTESSDGDDDGDG